MHDVAIEWRRAIFPPMLSLSTIQVPRLFRRYRWNPMMRISRMRLTILPVWLILASALCPAVLAQAPATGPWANAPSCRVEQPTCGPGPETCTPPPSRPVCQPPAQPNIVVNVPKQIELQRPALPEAAPAAVVGAYAAPAPTGVYQGASNTFGVEGMVITFPQIQLKFPSIQWPSFYSARRNPRMVTDSVEAPWVGGTAATMRATGVPMTAAVTPAYAAGTVPAYAIGAAPGYALANPYAAAVPVQPLVSAQAAPLALAQAQNQAAPSTAAPNTAAANPEELEAKLKQLQQREQYLLEKLETLQKYLQERDAGPRPATPPVPPAPIPQPGCQSQVPAGGWQVIQQSDYREPIEPQMPYNLVPVDQAVVRRLPQVR
jgi:hypothetical protein